MALRKGAVADSSHPLSYYPLALVGGIFSTIPIPFIMYFVTHNQAVASISAGVGAPLLIWALVGLVTEGVDSGKEERGWVLASLPWFFISETIFFISLVAGYSTIRLNADIWPPQGAKGPGVVFAVIITMLLASSGFTMRIAQIHLSKKEMKAFVRFLGITIALGAISMALLLTEQIVLSIAGFNFGANAQSNGYFCITGFYGSQLLIALSILLLQFILASSGKVRKTYISGIALFWYFLLFVWLFLVTLVYFW